jgi:chorismate synthase
MRTESADGADRGTRNEETATSNECVAFGVAHALFLVPGSVWIGYCAAMGSSFGALFRITTFGESHGPGLGVVVDGCPPRLALADTDIQRELDRRRPGQSRLVSQRKEDDRVEILSGVLDGVTLGTPIAMLIRNTDARGKDYDAIAHAYRPSHADFTYDAKYGIRAVAGGGRASARETAGRVAAGAVAQQLLAARGVVVVAWVDEVAGIAARVDGDAVTRAEVDANDVRCPDPAAAAAMVERIEAARKDGDSVGGVVRAVARGVPAGWGEPVFDKLDADVAKAMMSIPAVKGVEIGSGFAGTLMTGSTHNDLFVNKAGAIARSGLAGPRSNAPAGALRSVIGTLTNHSGGIQGGISNGEPVTVRVAFKPTATIMRPQPTVDRDGNATVLEPRGRHDPCVLPRAVPIVEAMLALVLADHLLRQAARGG